MARVAHAADLPKTARVGDLVRLKSERIGAYQEACRLAGWTEADLYAPKLVTREDNFAPGGGTRLFFDGPPFCYASVDVKLAWNTVAERLEGLRKAGTLVESAS